MSAASEKSEETIGDEFRIWTTPPHVTPVNPVPHESGTILTRIHNIVFCFAWQGSVEKAWRVARELERIIRDDREIAPWGTFEEAPEITTAGIPATLTAKTEIEVKPEVKGLGDPKEVMFAAEIERQWRSLSRDQLSKGSLVLRVPHDPGVLKVLVIAANSDSVFVTKVVEVNVIAESKDPDDAKKGE
jgi:hypothetical protein